MTSRELEILNIIYQLEDRCSIRMISKETGLSSDYAFLILRKLLNQKLIKQIANNVFILTASGKSFLERRKGGSKGKMKPPTLLAVSRCLGSEIHFVNPEASRQSGSCGAGREFMAEQPRLIEYNLGKDITIEVTDARSIQKSLKRLTFAKGRKLNIK